ncbi:MAG: DNA polymerase [Candidatus Altiarchaeales archaeon]|nr:DNA polymerase [Candidatus Altiarchaeales archaeon]MBD3415590.1 DNA polymerase [Candidatus Altiarchaeales archaeon]
MVMCVLDADYIVRDGKPIVRLYVKTSEGAGIELVEGVEPYFYALPVADAKVLSEELGGLSGVVRVEEKHMVDNGDPVDVVKVFASIPKDVPQLREAVLRLDSCRGYREADIPFARRYIIDSGIVPMDGSDQVELNVASVDIEVASGGEPNANRHPVAMISYADSRGLKRVWVAGKDNPGLEYVEAVGSEGEMLEKLVETVRTQEINIITGYNSDNFDFPYLKDRAEKNNVKLNLGFDGSEVRMERRGMNMGARVAGRPHVDMYPVCRQVFNLPRYQLEDVYESLFGERKLDIKVSQITEFYESEDSEKFKILCEYSMADAVATLKIALRMLPLMYELSKVIRQPVYETARMGSGQRVEYLLIDEAYKQGIVVPNRPGDREYGDRDDSPYEGAFVVDPVKGIHDNIVLFDFRSLYPSIIISHNVDPSKLDCDCCEGKAPRAPNNHHFCLEGVGFIPGVLKGLLDRRVSLKAEMKSEEDLERKSLLDVEQQAMKLLANSMYGYYGFQRARWYCRECAEAIAGWGRKYIQKTIKIAESKGFNVVYGDTDSVYITKSGLEDVDEIIRVAKDFQKEINAELPESMELEFEGFYPRGVFITKKRYALIDTQGKLTVKGLETRRRDWCDAAKSTQQKVLDALLRDRDPDKAAETVREMVQRIKSGEVPLSELTINTQMTRNIGGYVSEGPHIAAARKAMKAGMDFKQGDIITYVVTKGSGSNIGDKAVVVDFAEEGDYDPDYYVNNQVLPAVLRILEALGYQEDELKGLGRQTSLGDW